MSTTVSTRNAIAATPAPIRRRAARERATGSIGVGQRIALTTQWPAVSCSSSGTL